MKIEDRTTRTQAPPKPAEPPRRPTEGRGESAPVQKPSKPAPEPNKGQRIDTRA